LANYSLNFRVLVMMRVFSWVLLPVFTGGQQPLATYDAVPMEVRVPYQVGDCVRARKLIDYEDLNGQAKQVSKHDKGVLIHVAPDHVVVKWNHQSTLARAAAFPHQVSRASWPKGTIKTVSAFHKKGEITPPASTVAETQANLVESCLTVVEYHGFPPIIKPMPCVELWQNQMFTTPLTCRPGPIYWKKDPSLCMDAVHPELVQLRECNGLESQMFAMKEGMPDGDDFEGSLVGTGNTKDLCFKTKDNELTFSKCDKTQDAKFRFTDFDTVE